jgi:hypothetical protein
MVDDVTDIEKLLLEPDPLDAKVNAVIAVMRDEGVTLHVECPPKWRLSNGQEISAEVAHAVVCDLNIVSVSDAITVPGAMPDAWRYSNTLPPI